MTLDSRQVSPEHIAHLKAEKGVSDLLAFVGENPERDGLQDTPKRVVKAWAEMTRGYKEDPAQILDRRFMQDDEGVTPYRDLVLLKGIEFVSLCEHHCLPFDGTAAIGYIPGDDGRIVGISKLARLLDCFARRLQVQERLTCQIADALQTHLKPLGVIVVVEASHSCMKMRGVGKQNSTLITSALRGVFDTDIAARSEALRLIHPR
jgi:GTP cyclohydrolase I